MLTEIAETRQSAEAEEEAIGIVHLTPLILNIQQVGALLGGISQRKIRGMVSAGQFPKPRKIDRLSRWRRADIEAWVANL